MVQAVGQDPRLEGAVGQVVRRAEVNASYNCVDRHLDSWRRNKAAIIFEGEPGDTRVLTYRDLYREVNQCAAALKRLGVKKGDRVAIYLGMIPELPIAMLACARIGAPHTVIFAGFSATASPIASTTVALCSPLLPMAAGDAGNKIPSRRRWIARSRAVRRSRTCWWSTAPTMRPECR